MTSSGRASEPAATGVPTNPVVDGAVGRLPVAPRGVPAGYRFDVHARLPGALGRTGVIGTAHGAIATPAFVAVGTKGTVKSVLPESMAALGAQALLANAYHLYLQPGADII